MNPRILLAASALALVAAALAPSALAATSASASSEADCYGLIHTTKVVCGQETVGYYVDCYLYRNVITKWGECL